MDTPKNIKEAMDVLIAFKKSFICGREALILLEKYFKKPSD